MPATPAKTPAAFAKPVGCTAIAELGFPLAPLGPPVVPVGMVPQFTRLSEPSAKEGRTVGALNDGTWVANGQAVEYWLKKLFTRGSMLFT